MTDGAELDREIASYQQASGRRPRRERVDPSAAHNAGARERFARSRVPRGSSANDGEWAALRLGLKPMVRELVPREQWQAWSARCRSDGWVTASVEVPVSEAHDSGHVQPGAGKVVAVAGRDPAHLTRAVAVERSLLSEQSIAGWRSAVVEMGALLGYPRCCVDAFAQLDGFEHNRSAIAASAARTEFFEPLLNNLSLTAYHHVGWFPCRYDCAESVAIAREVDSWLAHNQPHPRSVYDALARLPRLYWDDRRQLLFEDVEWRGPLLHFGGVLTPAALVARGGGLSDWLFFADVAEPLAAGGVLDLRSMCVEGSATTAMTDGLWLPFGKPGGGDR